MAAERPRKREPNALSDYEFVAGMTAPRREEMLHALGEPGMRWLTRDWKMRARPNQKPPEGDWSVWLVMAGRGFGKTRMGAEWVSAIAQEDGRAVIALVGATLHEARSVMVEGPSGVLAAARHKDRPAWYPSRRELRWPSGARAHIFGAAEAEALRGPQHSHGWADEIGKWPDGERAWNNLILGLRLGQRPRLIATTTPRAVTLMLRLLGDPTVKITRGRTADNRGQLAKSFLDEMERSFGKTRLGRQELDGEYLQDVDGALWTRDLIEHCRRSPGAADRDAFTRIVVAVDPPASAAGDACGIVVVARDREDRGHVLADGSIAGASPERWARQVALVAQHWGADRIVAEANNGGDMVAAVLRAAGEELPVRLIHATRGKSARAEPVAALYEAGRVFHDGTFPALEDQLCGMTLNGGYQGPGRSPDRADALVWALTECCLSGAGRARLRRL